MIRAAKGVRPSFGPAISPASNQPKVLWATLPITAMWNANQSFGLPIIFAAILSDYLAWKIGLYALTFKAFLNH